MKITEPDGGELDAWDAARHPIGVVAERTGLSQEVLRVWERRYRVVEPARGAGGQRLYSDADVERLRLLHQAIQGGRQIGSVAGRSVEELTALVRDDEAERFPPASGGEGQGDLDASAALAAAARLDAVGLEALLRRSAALSGVPRFLEWSIAPFLRRVGDEWHQGRVSVAQEHMATAVVQRVVTSVLAALSSPGEGPLLLVATPAGDRHEMGGLLAAATGAAEGWRVLYLGPDLPAREIADAAKASAADAVGLSVVYVDDRSRLLSEMERLRALLPPSIPLLLGGAGAADLGEGSTAPGVRILPDLEALRETLRGWGARERR